MEEVSQATQLEEQQDFQQGQYIIFHLDDEYYGIETRHVMEIVGMFPITKMPEMDPFMKGIINLRGTIIPVMDMRLRFGKEEAAYTDRTCVIVTNVDGLETGLIVDEVAEVITIPEEQVAPPPEFSMAGSNPFVQGVTPIDDRILQLLNARRLLLEI